MTTRTAGAPLATMALCRAVLTALLTAALLATLIVPASAASKGCSVKNKATGRTYTTLQAAVDAAKPKTTLLVRGTCGGKTVIGHSLRIKGVSSGVWGAPRLTANGTPVIVVEHAVKVTVASLLIARGKGAINRGNTTFSNVRVKGAGFGDVPPRGKGDRRGILNTGALRLLGGSWVRGTSGVVNTGHLTLGGTTYIRSNVTPGCDPAVRNTGTLVMNGRSDIGRNYCDGGSRAWGAPLINTGRLVMNHRSSLSYQEGSLGVQGSNGAVRNLGTMVMNDHSSVHNNRAGAFWSFVDGTGGGVYNAGRLIMREHSAIHHNIAEHHDDGGQGGGVYNTGTLVMQGSAVINDNSAWDGQGGGLHNATGATLAGIRCGPRADANVYANTPDDCYFE